MVGTGQSSNGSGRCGVTTASGTRATTTASPSDRSVTIDTSASTSQTAAGAGFSARRCSSRARRKNAQRRRIWLSMGGKRRNRKCLLP